MSAWTSYDIVCDGDITRRVCPEFVQGTPISGRHYFPICGAFATTRRRARALGWTRREVQGRWRDFCPHHSAPIEHEEQIYESATSE